MRMHDGYDISYGGIRAASLGICIAERPDLPAAEEDVEEIEIPGRDGALHIKNDRKKPIEIKVKMGYREKFQWQNRWQQVKNWLKATNERLILSEDRDHFYKVYRVEVDALEHLSRKLGSFEAVFLCDPFRYLLSGEEWTDSLLLHNTGEVSHPLFLLKGEGMCTISVNGKSVKANIGQNLVIDTDRMIAYREDGTLMNTSMQGDYENLYLLEGENVITVTDGFQVSIKPRWRCL